MKRHRQKSEALCGFGRVPYKNFYKVNSIAVWFPTKTYTGTQIKFDHYDDDSVRGSDRLMNEILKFNIGKK